MEYEEAEHVLEVYDFETILELNNCALPDVLCFLVEQEFLELPDVKPL